jgi:[acyl-carrier-protein] S-malonyltransferase
LIAPAGEWPAGRASRVALVFPGQGSQYVGMGKLLHDTSQAARAVFERADEALGFALSRLCFEGPAEELDDTVNAQPAVLTAGIAALAAYQERRPAPGRELHPLCVAGHSLGEYTALVAAGAVEFTEALRLVRERGRLMKESASDRKGRMAAVVGLDESVVDALCRAVEHLGVIGIASSNAPDQVVISGELAPLERASELARARGARAIVPLRIPIAAHSALMQQAAARLLDVLGHVSFHEPRVPIAANVAGRFLTSVEQIRDELAEQIYRRVEWARAVREMIASGVDTFVEAGPGKVLSRLIVRVSDEVTVRSMTDSRAQGAE